MTGEEVIAEMATGTCVSCGAVDVEVNDEGKCSSCAGASTEGGEESSGESA